MAGVLMMLTVLSGCGGWRPGPELELPRGVKVVAVLKDNTVVLAADETRWRFASTSFVGDSVTLVCGNAERQVSCSIDTQFVLNEYTDTYHEDEWGEMHADLFNEGPPPYVSVQAQADWAVEHQGSFNQTVSEFVLISASTRMEIARCGRLTASPNRIVYDLAKELPGAAVDAEGTVYDASGKGIGFEANFEDWKDGKPYYVILPDRTDDD